jgi:SAM-dependent methyltransferase
MNNHLAWEKEYRSPQFLTLGTDPLSCVRDLTKWLRRKQKVDMTDFVVLDLGCGNGKNIKYIVESFAKSGIGYDISATAIAQASELKKDLPIHYEVRSIGGRYPLEDESIDLVLDMTSSNALNEVERVIYHDETFRVLKSGGYFFVRALCLDGDDNAKNLIKQFPGLEKDTYILAETGITERVFSKKDFLDLYSKFFQVVSLEKTSGYQKWGNQSYKRNYWLACLKKR